MSSDRLYAPTPDLRIVNTASLLPHEIHDSQRALPLIERLQSESYMINPPVVAPLEGDQFIILDGANRCHAFQALDYPHMLVQVVTYESGLVELETWNHVIGRWSESILIAQLNQLPDIEILQGQHARAIAHVLTRSQDILALCAAVDNAHERNEALCKVVDIYQKNAALHRTTLSEPEEIWPMFPDSAAVLFFRHYQPADIVAAAKYQAWLPPGISRHIVHGRALRVNYPMTLLKDEQVSLQDKNEALKHWMREKLAHRQIRYYAEATYQFDE
ncbi:MAG: hypothetical protein CL610_09295 [Anaerolineaceae bacterium]|nr:hypothetical protein [Anaerolineaceae bacterium]